MSQLNDWQDVHGDFFDGKTALVTGGAGFIGSHIAKALLDCGSRVVVLDNMSGGLESNIKYLRDIGGDLKVIKASLLDRKKLAQAMGNVTYVFHQAALGSVPMSVENPRGFHDANVNGTMNVLEAAREAKVSRVMFASSSAIYGDAPQLPKKESFAPKPLSPYAANKLAGEALMSAWARSYEIDTVSLRYFNIFGPRQNANSAYAAVIAAFAKAAINNENLKIFGDGTQSRDFCFVEDVVQANLLAARFSDELNGEVFNVASGKSTTVNELAKDVIDIYGKENLATQYLDSRAGDVKHSLADISRIKDVLGYKSIVDFEAGLEETLTWYQNN